ncbi:MAG: hypothetical protein U9R02_13635 [Thermodesulfobacteriota bacterium]|nr:hypothetical protein [Thermodesulfobacteriota bacterium]
MNDGTLKGVELKNMKVLFAGPECDPHPSGISSAFVESAPLSLA